MSGVLDRMAQRATGALPAVEPLVASRYTPARGERRETWLEQGTGLEQALETVVETEAPAQRAEASGVDGVHMPGDAAWKGKWTRADEDRNANLPAAKKREAEESLVRAAAPRRQRERNANEPHARAAMPRGAAEAIDRPVGARNEDGSARTAELAPREARNEERVRPQRTERQYAETGAEAAREKRRESERESTIAPRREESRREFSAIAGVPKRNRMAARSEPPVGRREMAARVEQPAPPAEEKTEIHISIGSVELRAAQVEQRPQPAPFRPRVTLDEFLRRGQETRP